MQRYELPQIIKMAFHKRNSTQVLAFLKYSMHSSTNVRVHYELKKKKGPKWQNVLMLCFVFNSCSRLTLLKVLYTISAILLTYARLSTNLTSENTTA